MDNQYLEATVLEVFCENGEKIAHIMGDSYYAADGTDTPYRFVEYTWGCIPFKEILANGMPNGDWFCELKQYIEDCNYEQLRSFYEHYDNGRMPQVIKEITPDLPCGYYILLASK